LVMPLMVGWGGVDRGWLEKTFARVRVVNEEELGDRAVGFVKLEGPGVARALPRAFQRSSSIVSLSLSDGVVFRVVGVPDGGEWFFLGWPLLR